MAHMRKLPVSNFQTLDGYYESTHNGDLANNPRPPGSAKLAGRDDFRIRVGDYRIVYAVDDVTQLVLIARTADRRDVHRQ